MRGPSIVGFGSLPLRLCERHAGENCIAGFAALGRPRRLSRSRIVNEKLMASSASTRHCKGCLYIDKLDDVDRSVLRKLVEYSSSASKAPAGVSPECTACAACPGQRLVQESLT